MTSRSPETAVVALAALDLRRRPDHRSEMRSQLLTGEVVDVLGVASGGSWLDVRNRADGYRGWVRAWGLVPASRRRAAGWVQRARARVSEPIVVLRATPAGATSVGPLFLNARVIPGRAAGTFREIELPDGRRGWVPRSALATSTSPRPSMADRVKSLLGSPYLWGGRTPAGFDCSSYVQQVLAERGVALPRDAWEQRAACRELDHPGQLEEGDLVFFGVPRGRVSHVALALGGGYVTDCRGRVRIVALEPRNPLYDKKLMDQVRGCGRPLRKAARGPFPTQNRLDRA